jgi:hypothetical protein
MIIYNNCLVVFNLRKAEYQSDNVMQRLKTAIVNQYKLTKFYFIVSVFIISISSLTVYSAILLSEHNSEKDDAQTKSIIHLVNSTKSWNEYQAYKLKEKIYQMQIDNLNIDLNDKNHQQPSTIDQRRQTLANYTRLSGELHADKSTEDSLKSIRYKAETASNVSYPKSIEEIDNNKKFVEQYNYVTILLFMGASLGGISEIAKNKSLGYSAFIFGGLGLVIPLVTIFISA